jgi:hypothetical protein
MRRLAQPQVLKSASAAACLTALLCYPRLVLWRHRPDPIWFLESIIFLGTMVLWGFVFAWHSAYSRRPVFTLPLETSEWGTAALAACVVALVLHRFLDPVLQPLNPVDYPTDLGEWSAMILFNLAFVQLFLVFAPLAWLMRLTQNRSLAILLTVLGGVGILALKIRSLPTTYSPTLLAALVIFRIVFGFFSVFFYWRGGVLLAWWWVMLVEARHLFTLPGSH